MAEEERGAAGVAALAEANAPGFETLVRMTLDTFGRSGPDQGTCLLARIAALVTIDASAHGKADRPGLTSGSGRLAHPGPKAPPACTATSDTDDTEQEKQWAAM